MQNITIECLEIKLITTEAAGEALGKLKVEDYTSALILVQL
jgi:hypothetical protein